MVFEQNTGQRPRLGYGDEVDLTWSRDHAFLLDAEQDAQAGTMTPDPEERRMTSPVARPGPAAGRRATQASSRVGLAAARPRDALAGGLLPASRRSSCSSPRCYDPSGSYVQGYSMTWHFANYADAMRDTWNLFVRSFAYAGIATVVCLLLGLPARVRDRVQGPGAGRTSCWCW